MKVEPFCEKVYPVRTPSVIYTRQAREAHRVASIAVEIVAVDVGAGAFHRRQPVSSTVVVPALNPFDVT